MVNFTTVDNQAIEQEFLNQYKDEDLSFDKKIKKVIIDDDSKTFIQMYKKNSLQIRSIFKDKLEKNLIILGKVKIINSLIKIQSFQLDQPLSFYLTLILKNAKSNNKKLINTPQIKLKFENQINVLKLLFKQGFYYFNGNYDWNFFFINLNHQLISFNTFKHLEKIFNENQNVSYQDMLTNYSPLCLALQENSKKYTNVLKKMIELGSNVNHSHIYNDNIIDFPLKTAITCDNFEGVKILIENKATFSQNYYFLLDIAIENNNLKILKYLIENTPDLDINKTNCLHTACLYQHYDIIQYLLSVGANPNVLAFDNDIEDEFPLEIALIYNDFKMCDILIDAGAKPYFKNKQNIPILDLIIKNNDLKALMYLHKKSPINFRSSENEFLFLDSIMYSSVDMIFWFINNGYNVNKVYLKKQLSPLALALEKNRKEVVQLLLDNGAVINIKSFYRPLLAAFLHSDISLIKILLQYTKINLFSDLLQAIPLRKYEHIEAYDLLISQGAKLEEPGLNGEFPLYAALRTENPDVIKYILKQKIDLNKKNNEGKTVLDHCLERGNLLLFNEIRNSINKQEIKNNDNIIYISPVFQIIYPTE